jgi:hypothetical protein
MLRTVVIDIEGTHRDDPATCRAVAQVREMIGDLQAKPDSVVTALLGWLGCDEKVTPLKARRA